MNIKKYILLIGASLMLTASLQAAQIVVNATTNGPYLLSTNRASVYSIEIASPNTTTISLYDSGDQILAPLWGTNYTNLTFVSKVVYPTNYVTSYINAQGYTNWYTNAGVYTLTQTNVPGTAGALGTNQLPVVASFVGAAGTYAVHTLDALFSRGIVALISTNASIVINYKTGQ